MKSSINNSTNSLKIKSNSTKNHNLMSNISSLQNPNTNTNTNSTRKEETDEDDINNLL